MIYNQLKPGDFVYDSDMDEYGIVKEIEDIHNVFVSYENEGSGLYCLDPSCEEYDGNLKIIKKH